MDSNNGSLDKSGYLTKQGEIIQSWKRRWFVLHGKVLKYYKDESHAVSGKSPKGTISLSSYKVKKVANYTFCNKPNAFVLLPKERQERPYLIYADTEKEMNDWMQYILVSTEELTGLINATDEEIVEYRDLIEESKSRRDLDDQAEEKEDKNPLLEQMVQDMSGDDKKKPRKKLVGNQRTAPTKQEALEARDVLAALTGKDEEETKKDSASKYPRRKNLLASQRNKVETDKKEQPEADKQIMMQDFNKEEHGMMEQQEMKSEEKRKSEMMEGQEKSLSEMPEMMKKEEKGMMEQEKKMPETMEKEKGMAEMMADLEMKGSQMMEQEKKMPEMMADQGMKGSGMMEQEKKMPEMMADQGMKGSGMMEQEKKMPETMEKQKEMPTMMEQEKNMPQMMADQGMKGSGMMEQEKKMPEMMKQEEKGMMEQEKKMPEMMKKEEKGMMEQEKKMPEMMLDQGMKGSGMMEQEKKMPEMMKQEKENEEKKMMEQEKKVMEILELERKEKEAMELLQMIEQGKQDNSEKMEDEKRRMEQEKKDKEANTILEMLEQEGKQSNQETKTMMMTSGKEKVTTPQQKAPSGMNGDFSWLSFFQQAEFDEETAISLEQIFISNQLEENDIKDLDHELLQSIGVPIAKNRLKILKMKGKWLEKKANKKTPTTLTKSNPDAQPLPALAPVKDLALNFEEKIAKITQEKSQSVTRKTSKKE